MNCPDLDRLIQDRIDGCLPEGEARLLDAHLADCGACRAEELRLRELVGSLGRLDLDAEPARDLWPALEARLEASAHLAPGPAPSGMPWFRIAAAALILAGLVGSFGLMRSSSGPDAKALSDEHQEVFAEYERAAQALVNALESRREQFSSATLEEIDSNLIVIEDALTRTRDALQSSPRDSDLIELHYALLGRKANVLQDLVMLPSDSSVTTDDSRDTP